MRDGGEEARQAHRLGEGREPAEVGELVLRGEVGADQQDGQGGVAITGEAGELHAVDAGELVRALLLQLHPPSPRSTYPS